MSILTGCLDSGGLALSILIIGADHLGKIAENLFSMGFG